MGNSTFTICITCHNSLQNGHRVFIGCLNSAIKQKYDINKYRIVAINDGSTDQTESVLLDIQKKIGKSRFEVISHKMMGMPYVRYEIIRKTRTDYLLFLDHDDLLP